MSLHHRVFWLSVGFVVGLVLGYIVRWLQENRGSMKPFKNLGHNRINQAALFLIVAITVAAAIFSQSNSNRVTDTQNQIKRISLCNQLFTEKTISALNARTTFSSEQAQANIDLQNAQIKYLQEVAVIPPVSDADREADRNVYISALTKFLNIQKKTSTTIDKNPYPTTQDFNLCLTAKD